MTRILPLSTVWCSNALNPKAPSQGSFGGLAFFCTPLFWTLLVSLVLHAALLYWKPEPVRVTRYKKALADTLSVRLQQSVASLRMPETKPQALHNEGLAPAENPAATATVAAVDPPPAAPPPPQPAETVPRPPETTQPERPPPVQATSTASAQTEPHRISGSFGRRRREIPPDAMAYLHQQAEFHNRQAMLGNLLMGLLSELNTQFRPGPDIQCRLRRPMACEPYDEIASAFLAARLGWMPEQYPELQAIVLERQGGSWRPANGPAPVAGGHSMQSND